MKIGSLVRQELHVSPWAGRIMSSEYRVGIVIKIDAFKAPEAGEISELIQDWLADMGPRVEVFWSDCMVTVQPGNSLEVLSADVFNQQGERIES